MVTAGSAVSACEPVGEDSGSGKSSLAAARMYLYLLPLSVLATFYGLMADRFTAHSAAELARASYGWPFNWVTQDLARYDPVEFPVTIAFNWRRDWSDPVATSYDWIMLAANTLIVGVLVTAVFYAIVFSLNRIAARRRRSA